MRAHVGSLCEREIVLKLLALRRAPAGPPSRGWGFSLLRAGHHYCCFGGAGGLLPGAVVAPVFFFFFFSLVFGFVGSAAGA
jgi:hypothetical protein